MEHRLFEGDVPFVSTLGFHADRERAPHLEQEFHRPRLFKAAEFVRLITDRAPVGARTVSDLGCGDGGLLSLLADGGDITAWGYDFCPANQAGWEERGVIAQALDVFGADWPRIQLGHVVVMTEVLEHLADPHGVLRRIHGLLQGQDHWLVCSSPWNESPNSHSPEHAWAWDVPGYAALVEGAGWTIQRHEQVGLFQVIQARA